MIPKVGSKILIPNGYYPSGKARPWLSATVDKVAGQYVFFTEIKNKKPGIIPTSHFKAKKTVKAKSKTKRKVNPATSTRRKIKKAMSLYKRFREQEPEFIDDVAIEWPTVGIVIGKCDGILYNTTRGGKKEYYKHEFSGSSCPTLCSSFDGKQIFLIGGNYNFTEDGIVDK